MPARILFEHSKSFKEAVAKSGGKVVLLVHPFYAKYREAVTHQTTAMTKYKKVLNELLRKTKAPLVILEEEDNIDKTSSVAGNAPFFVETREHDPTPLRSWYELHRELREAGVKTLLIGGCYASSATSIDAYFTHPSIVEYERSLRRRVFRSIVGGCIGKTYGEMIEANHGKIRLMPNLLFPDKPLYGKPKETLLKRTLRRLAELKAKIKRR